MLQVIHIHRNKEEDFKYILPGEIHFLYHTSVPGGIGGYGAITSLYHQLMSMHKTYGGIEYHTVAFETQHPPRLEEALKDHEDPQIRKAIRDFIHACHLIANSPKKAKLLKQVPIGFILVGVSEELGRLLQADGNMQCSFSLTKIKSKFDERRNLFVIRNEEYDGPAIWFYNNVTLTTTLYDLIKHMEAMYEYIIGKTDDVVTYHTITDFYTSIAGYLYVEFPGIVDQLCLKFRDLYQKLY